MTLRKVGAGQRVFVGDGHGRGQAGRLEARGVHYQRSVQLELRRQHTQPISGGLDRDYGRVQGECTAVPLDIAEQIAATLGVVLDDEQVARMQAVGVRNPEAFVAMQKGIEGFYAAHGKPNQNELLKENNAWFEKTLALEPGISDAYAFHADYYTHLLLTGLDSADSDENELQIAYDHLVADLDNAVRHAKNDSERAASRFELSILTGNWRGLPELFTEAVRDNKCRASGWIDAIGLAYGKADAFAQMSERLTRCDPFAYSPWRWLTTAQIWAGDAENAIETAQRGQTYARHIRIQQQLVLGLIAVGRVDDAEQVIARDVRDEFHKVRLQLAIESARGDLERSQETIRRLSQMENDVNHLALIEYARIGDRETANRHAAKLDAMPLGFIRLMLMPASCYCGAPWDLENTPNFARLLEDAELPWPPA